MKNDITTEFVADQLSYAKELFDAGKKAKNADDIIRAEYYTHVALNYDGENEEALALLSKCRQELVKTYTAFPRVILDKPDTALFRRVDTTDIFLAVPAMSKTRTQITMKANIYNYTYAGLRLKKEHFFLLDEDGKKYSCTSLDVDEEMLQQEHESEMTLKFRRPAGKIKAIVFEQTINDDLFHAPKYFF